MAKPNTQNLRLLGEESSSGFHYPRMNGKWGTMASHNPERRGIKILHRREREAEGWNDEEA